MIIDARGDAVVNTIADKSGFFAFNILQVSDWNSKLRSIVEYSQSTGLSSNAAYFVPVQGLISDKMGNTVVSGFNGVLLEQPAVVRGTGIVTVPWVIRFERVNFDEGQYPTRFE